MAQLPNISIPKYNPDNAVTMPTRPVSGPIKFDNLTPSDTDDLPQYARWVKCGTQAAIKFLLWDGTEVTDSVGLLPGVWHPVFFKRIFATGTSATGFMWGN